MRRMYKAVLVASLFAIQSSIAQTTLNPDLSIIPRFLLKTDDGEKLAQGTREFSTPDFSFEELELVFGGYLNPYARADATLAIAGPDVDNLSLSLEEVYGTVLKGLPLDLNIRFGKYRVDYGKINMTHPHAWAFVTQPLSQTRFLGEGGLNDLGISLSTLLPTGDTYSKLTIDVLRGLSVASAAGIEDTCGAKPSYAFSGRLMSFFALDDNSDIEVGLSGYTGIHDPYANLRFWYGNLDFKYKYRPSTYTSFTLQGEYLLNIRDAVQDQTLTPFLDASGNPTTRRITSSGVYLFGNYQFERVFSVGARYDWSQSPYSTEDKAHAIAVFLGYYPVEETLGLRLQYQNTLRQIPTGSQSVNLVAVQVVMSLGPHKAHPF